MKRVSYKETWVDKLYIPAVLKGLIVTVKHTWENKGTYNIRAKAKDPSGLESDWRTLSVTMPRNRMINNPMFKEFMEGFMDRFPLFARLLRL